MQGIREIPLEKERTPDRAISSLGRGAREARGRELTSLHHYHRLFLVLFFRVSWLYSLSSDAGLIDRDVGRAGPRGH